MTPNEFSILDFIKDFLWAPALGLIAWAWNRNQKEHDDLRESHEKLSDSTHTGHSTLNDKIMEYVDTVVGDMKDEQRRKSDKLALHIEKLFENAEKDRKEFSKVMTDHREDSYKRHIELLQAIHNKADRKDIP
jgi:uncharacterized protein YicC (UPF0701 family)